VEVAHTLSHRSHDDAYHLQSVVLVVMGYVVGLRLQTKNILATPIRESPLTDLSYAERRIALMSKVDIVHGGFDYPVLGGNHSAYRV